MRDLSRGAKERLLDVFLEGIDYLADNEGFQINGTFGMMRKAAFWIGGNRLAAVVPPVYIGANLAFAFNEVALELNPQISNVPMYTPEIAKYEQSALKMRTKII